VSSRGRTAAVVTAAAATLAACGVRDPNTTSAPASRTSTTQPAPPPPRRELTAEQINRQDHPPERMLRRQRAAAAARPMLPALPIRAGGVTISITGLAADHATTVLRVSRGHRSRAHALGVYERQLRRYGDPGVAYTVRVTP